MPILTSMKVNNHFSLVLTRNKIKHTTPASAASSRLLADYILITRKN